jgi:xylose isomerase
MALTAQQLSDLRTDLGDSNTAFGDSELQRNWDRMVNAASDLQRHNATLALSWRQLLASASKLHDYTAGATGEKLKQVRDNIKDMYELYADDLEAALGTNSNILKSKIASYPHQTRTLPSEEIGRQRRIGSGSIE